MTIERRIRVGDTSYRNANIASEMLGVTKSVLYKRLRSDSEKWKDWYWEDVEFDVEEDEEASSEFAERVFESGQEWYPVYITWVQDGMLKYTVANTVADLSSDDVDAFATLYRDLIRVNRDLAPVVNFMTQGHSGTWIMGCHGSEQSEQVIIQSTDSLQSLRIVMIEPGSSLVVINRLTGEVSKYLEFVDTDTGLSRYFDDLHYPVNSERNYYTHRNDWIPVWLNRELQELIPEEGNRQLVLGCPNLIETYLAFGKRHPRIDTFDVIRMVSSVRGEINRIKASGCSDRIVMTTRAGLINVFKNLDL